MPPKSKKRKTVDEENAPRVENPSNDAGSNVVGGMRGDYRITGTESSSEYEIFTIPDVTGKEIPCQLRKPQCSSKSSQTTLIFTHGAGGGLENPATKLFAEGYAAQAPVVCFQGTMNLQSRAKSFGSVLSCLQDEEPKIKFAAGGRSMGARAAVLLAQDYDEVKKLVLVSYPLIGPKGDKRDQILLNLPKDKEVLFAFGSDDNMNDIKTLQSVQKKMKAKSTLLVFEKLDHSMAMTSGVIGKDRTLAVEELRKFGGEQAAAWIHDSASINDGCRVSWDKENKTIKVDKQMATALESEKVKDTKPENTTKDKAKSGSDGKPARASKKRKVG